MSEASPQAEPVPPGAQPAPWRARAEDIFASSSSHLAPRALICQTRAVPSLLRLRLCIEDTAKYAGPEPSEVFFLDASSSCHFARRMLRRTPAGAIRSLLDASSNFAQRMLRLRKTPVQSHPNSCFWICLALVCEGCSEQHRARVVPRFFCIEDLEDAHRRFGDTPDNGHPNSCSWGLMGMSYMLCLSIPWARVIRILLRGFARKLAVTMLLPVVSHMPGQSSSLLSS